MKIITNEVRSGKTLEFRRDLRENRGNLDWKTNKVRIFANYMSQFVLLDFFIVGDLARTVPNTTGLSLYNAAISLI